MGRFQTQDPGDKQDWSNDWTDYLVGGDTIASRLWTISPDASPSLLSNETTASVLVDGLVLGTIYRLSEKITTVAGIEGERSITIRCEEL